MPRPLPSSRPPLAREQKLAFGFVICTGLIGVVLGIRSFGVAARRPFDLQRAQYDGPALVLDSEREAAEAEAERQRDSDQDGLSDYDELRVYSTSAFVADSDSDGFSDFTEVSSGNDPNCPAGQDCPGAGANSEGSSGLDPTSLISLPGEAPATRPQAPALGVLESPQDLEAFLAGLTPEEIRALLAERGIPRTVLDQIPDEQLLSLFEEAIARAKTDGTLDQALEATPESER